jgi:hypothetical protein
VGRSEKVAREADEILEPHRLEAEFRAELTQLARDFVFEEIVAGDDRDWCQALGIEGSQAAKEAEAVDERHSQVKDDRVRLAFLRKVETVFGRHGGPNLIPFEPQHAGKRLSDDFVVVDDEDFRRHGSGSWPGHVVIVTDVVLLGTRPTTTRSVELDESMLNFRVFAFALAFQLVGGVW